MWISFSNLIADCEYSQNNLNHNTLVLVNIMTSLPKGSSEVVLHELNTTQLNVNLRTQVKHLIVRIYLSKLNTKLYVTYYSY